MRYVNGFLFNEATDIVALIEKQKPEWQKGRLNGIGGKIEEGETPLEAMRREFKEETGETIEDWREFALLNHSGHQVHFFVAFAIGRQVRLESTTEEKVSWYLVDDLYEHPLVNKVIGNLLWLIPLALDRDNLTAVVHDETTPWEKDEKRVLDQQSAS